MSSRNSSYSNPIPCKHLADYKLRYGLNAYKSIQKCLKTAPNGRTRIQNLDTEIPKCYSCNRYDGRRYFCLICSSISCSNHTLLHIESEDSHVIAVDVDRAELYCCVCSDQVYDPDFDKCVMTKHIKGFTKDLEESESIGERLSKRRRLSSVFVEELLDSKKLKSLNSLGDLRQKSCYPLGLRGLNNLGSTCFMNSILQVLIHSPPFRNYFLTDQHSRQSCRRRSADHLCLPCDIAAIFSAVFSGDRTPYTPAPFLHSWWQHSTNLASYEQQDAHEFFISLLDSIHEKEAKTRNHSRGHGDCKCIAHKVFSGQLRSDVTCMTCGFTSTTYDPCLDISLDLNKSNDRSISTLYGCLDLFTRLEKLGSDQKLFCQNCQERQNSLKQMSIRRLPLVLSLHMKRFEHLSVNNTSKKIDRYLHFPFSLDMMPYLSSSIVRNRFGNRIFAFQGDESDVSTKFEIFAVIAHFGTLESGHYVTYLRLREQWYKCDDAWITKVDEGVVRNVQCYMLFYLQKKLCSKSNDDFGCLPTSPCADSCCSAAGCCRATGQLRRR